MLLVLCCFDPDETYFKCRDEDAYNLIKNYIFKFKQTVLVIFYA